MRKKKIKIGLLRETKIPADKRVVLTPRQAKKLLCTYPELEIIVQPSEERIFPDALYRKCGIEIKEDLSECDYLLGVKEVAIDALIPNKHYFFFGHIAKQQTYSQPLKQAMMDRQITFTDYEYLRRNKRRVCAFGWEAGVVGTYNTIQMYGMKYNKFLIPPLYGANLRDMEKYLTRIKTYFLSCGPKILITGNGRVAKGAMDVLSLLEVPRIPLPAFLIKEDKCCYSVARHRDLLIDEQGKYSKVEAYANPEKYTSIFTQYARETDILISCHFWDGKSPKYLTKELVNSGSRIRCVGDITCDIQGSIETTLRPSTHTSPFYDVTRDLEEAPLFADKENISVMAVDNLPNAIAAEASKHFGEQLIQHGVVQRLIKGKMDHMMNNATILRNGEVTEAFAYLR